MSGRLRAGICLVIVAALSACSYGAGDTQHAQGVGSALTTVSPAHSGLTFSYPRSWSRVHCTQVTSFTDSIAWLTSSGGPLECPKHNGVMSPLPSTQLAPHSLLAVWGSAGFPGVQGVGRFPGRTTIIGGRPAKIEVTRRLRQCAVAGAEERIDATIQRRPADNWDAVTVCIRGPGIDELEAQALAMIRSARLHD